MEHVSSSSPSPSSDDMQRSRVMVHFALLYAKERKRVLPLHSLRPPDKCTCGRAECRNVAKHPVTRNGVKDATSDAEQIKEWWRLYPFANVGIATGQGLLVVDLDPRHGGTLKALNKLLELPETAIAYWQRWSAPVLLL